MTFSKKLSFAFWTLWNVRVYGKHKASGVFSHNLRGLCFSYICSKITNTIFRYVQSKRKPILRWFVNSLNSIYSTTTFGFFLIFTNKLESIPHYESYVCIYLIFNSVWTRPRIRPISQQRNRTPAESLVTKLNLVGLRINLKKQTFRTSKDAANELWNSAYEYTLRATVKRMYDKMLNSQCICGFR